MSEAQVVAATDAELGLELSDKPRGMFVRAWEVFAENKLALAGLGFIVFILLFCFVGPHIYVTNQVNTDLIDTLCTPSGQHLLGCDDVGYDELGRLMAGGADTTPAEGTAPAEATAGGEDDGSAADASPITGIGTPGTGSPAAQEDS